MKDIIVLLPGITGSVLQKDGKDLWALSNQAAQNFFKSIGNSIQLLKLEGDDYTIDDLEDGVIATSVVQDAHLVPGLVKVDGYTAISRRIQDEFDVIPGKNYFEFAYDWRRDNRFSARKLEQFINLKLTDWRNDSNGYENAKVILIAHSMGGLVARYYLEVLGGWQSCKALFSFGTPYRGSINALGFLANGFQGGYTQKIIDWLVRPTEVMRSLTSLYQLLPIYPILKVGDNDYQRVAETDNIPNLIKNKAEDALKFHREIEDAQKINAQDEQYQNNFIIIPYVGSEQKTNQSALLLDEELKLSEELPSILSNEDDGGDGTVPRISATPIEFDTNNKLMSLSSYFAEKHGTLQINGSVLLNLIEQLRNLQLPERKPIRGGSTTTAIGVELDDLYFQDESVTIKAEVKGRFPKPVKDKLALEAYIQSVSNNSTQRRVEFQKFESEWLLSINDLEPGLYRLEVKTLQNGNAFPNPVHDLFEVV